MVTFFIIALFHIIFGLSLNFQRLLGCLAITLPLFAYKKIFYGTDLSNSSIQFPFLAKHLLMGAVYTLSSLVCFFSFFNRTMDYVVSSDFGRYFIFLIIVFLLISDRFFCLDMLWYLHYIEHSFLLLEENLC